MSVNQALLSRINNMIKMPLFSPLTGQPKSMAIITPAIPSQWSFYGYIIAGVIIFYKNHGGLSSTQVNDDEIRRERMPSKFASDQGIKTQEYFVYFKFL